MNNSPISISLMFEIIIEHTRAQLDTQIWYKRINLACVPFKGLVLSQVASPVPGEQVIVEHVSAGEKDIMAVVGSYKVSGDNARATIASLSKMGWKRTSIGLQKEPNA